MENLNIDAVCGGNASSRVMDKRKKLHDFVRLSFTRDHPMMFVCQKEGRVPDPVVLEIDIEAVSLPGSLFSDRNANSSQASTSSTPDLIRWNVVKCKSQFDVDVEEKPFYQAEVLIKTALPEMFIHFPSMKVEEVVSLPWSLQTNLDPAFGQTA